MDYYVVIGLLVTAIIMSAVAYGQNKALNLIKKEEIKRLMDLASAMQHKIVEQQMEIAEYEHREREQKKSNNYKKPIHEGLG